MCYNSDVELTRSGNSTALSIEPFEKVRCGRNPMMRKFMGG